MTRIVLAPDSFKGSIRAADAARAMAEGWHRAEPTAEVVLRPMADGGEGTLDAFAAAVPGARRVGIRVPGPAGGAPATETSWLLLPPSPEAPDGTAVVELASTCGIELYGRRRAPWAASTEAFGRAIGHALDRGVSRLVLAIGSSASTDGGAGMLHALGARLRAGSETVAPAGAESLRGIDAVDLSGLRRPPSGGAVVLADVTNPLTGPDGAAAVFGPQKGFEPDEIAGVDGILARYSQLFPPDAGRLLARSPGAGAAGGVGFALGVWGAQLRPGAAEVARLIGLREALAEASLVVTGEGAFDGQSASGKAPAYAAALARRAGVPAALIAGRIDPSADVSGFAAAVSLVDAAGSVDAALRDPARWLRAAAERLHAELPRP